VEHSGLTNTSLLLGEEVPSIKPAGQSVTAIRSTGPHSPKGGPGGTVF